MWCMYSYACIYCITCICPCQEARTCVHHTHVSPRWGSFSITVDDLLIIISLLLCFAARIVPRHIRPRHDQLMLGNQQRSFEPRTDRQVPADIICLAPLD